MKNVFSAKKRAAFAIPAAGLVATVGLIGGVAMTGTLGGWTTQTINQVTYDSSTAMTFQQVKVTDITGATPDGAAVTSTIAGITTQMFDAAVPMLAPNETGTQTFVKVYGGSLVGVNANYTIEAADFKLLNGATEITEPAAIAAVFDNITVNLGVTGVDGATGAQLSTPVSGMTLTALINAGVLSVTDGAANLAITPDQGLVFDAQAFTGAIDGAYAGYEVTGTLIIKATPL